uniref:Uncharacterized protein n=1 Tax=Peronospora matthiolae TaxID=2874970 RepID=A0AAV1TQN7_9STRA
MQRGAQSSATHARSRGAMTIFVDMNAKLRTLLVKREKSRIPWRKDADAFVNE